MIRERSSFRQNGQVSCANRHRRGAPAADEQAIGGRRDHRQVRLSAAERAVPTLPIGKVAPGHDRFGGADQERPHRLRNYSLQPGFSVETVGARPHRVVPHPDGRRQLVGVSRERLGAAVVDFFQRLVRAHGGSRRAQQETDIVPVDDQMIELQDRAVAEQVVQVFGLEFDGRQPEPGLDAALELNEFDLEIGGGRELGLIVLQSPELDDLARFTSARRALRIIHVDRY